MSEEVQDSGLLANLRTQSKMALALGSLILLVLVGAFSTLTAQREASDRRAWVTHTHDVLNEISQMTIALLDQETGLRGYVISGQPTFIESMRTGQQHYRESLANLRILYADNPVQQQRLLEIERSADEWQHGFVEPVQGWADLPATRDQAIEMIAHGEGKRRTDHIRVVLGDMEDTERILLDARDKASVAADHYAVALSLILIAAGVLLGALALVTSQRLIIRPLTTITDLMSRLAAHDMEIVVPNTRRKDEIGALARALEVFKKTTIDTYNQGWIKTQVASLSGELQEAKTQAEFGESLITGVTPLLGSVVGMFYQLEDDGALHLVSSYGYSDVSNLTKVWRPGEGLVGQCAREGKPIVLTDMPQDYLRIRSALGEAQPRTLLILPVQTKELLLGVLELGSFGRFSDLHHGFIDELMPLLALSMENLGRALKTQLLLEKTQAQAEELSVSEESLRAQQEELRVTNEQLERQSRQLRASEEELRVQSEELKVANEEMQAKTEILARQRDLLEKLQQETHQKAEDLAQASRYKSEFLANMSHELRTPLNSMLILSKSLADNDGGNLDKDQQEAAGIINDSGHNLLRLINDILDLSKVEAGKMDVFVETIELSGFSANVDRNFRHVARERKLDFKLSVADGMPASIEQDGAKINQIVTNLLSNAFKFTAKGAVTLDIGRPEANEFLDGIAPEHTVCFRVSDSGIGIPADKLQHIFEAFEQVDGTTSRKYGGTGLGLSISRSFAQLLGGDIRIRSVDGHGSSFTLSLPVTLEKARAAVSRLPSRRAPAAAATVPTSAPADAPAAVPITMPEPPPDSGKPLILVVEDDPTFSKILADATRKRGCEVITAADGPSGYAAAEKYKPTGIILDVALPGMDGWTVMENLKANPQTRHIPVHFMSAEDDSLRGLGMGAVGYMVKPVSREGINAAFDKVLHFATGAPRKLLLVDDDRGSRMAVRTLIDIPELEITEAQTGSEGLDLLKAGGYDCLILDLMLPDMDGHEFLKRATRDGPIPPVVIYSAKSLSVEETAKLRQYTDSIVIKSARSPERLLDEVTLFLHSIRDAHTPAAKVERAAAADLSGKTALIVDDDMRNVFALSRVLRARGLNVVMAEDGYKALAQLEQNKLIDIVLMDIMMPGMDGYATMREIRKRGEWAKLPIIAVSAKAMRGDREKCLEAGANDYLSKPIDVDKLASMMRVYL